MPDTTYQRAVGAVDAVVDGQVVLLSPDDLSYHALDPVGAAVWSLLATPQTVDELVDALTTRFTVSAEQCRADLDPFLSRMTTIGVLTASGG